MTRPTIDEIVGGLERGQDPVAQIPAKTPFEHVLWETACYLVPDERRHEVYARLRREVGTTPKKILAASTTKLVGAIRDGGMKPEMRANRIRDAAAIAEELGELDAVAKRPLREATKAFARFPGIGAPGAEKILLRIGAHAVPALESNGLRVLERIGFGSGGSYAATYRAVRATLFADGAHDGPFWARAHDVLRRHGQEICRRSIPLCRACALRARCAFGSRRPATTPIAEA